MDPVSVPGYFPAWRSSPMAASARSFVRSIRRPALAALTATALMVSLSATPTLARGPDGIAEVAETVIDAVVNISTSQTIDSKVGPMPQLPPGSPFEEFFDEFFKNRRGQGDNPNREHTPRRVNSLGSGFIIDASGIVVTNNHVISDADEINVILNDGTRIKAELIGKDKE